MDLPSNIRELIVAHHQVGKRSREIGQMLSVSKSVVNNILKRYRNTGSVDPTRVGKCGRPRLLSDSDERMLARASVANPTFNARDLRACVGGSVARCQWIPSKELSDVKEDLPIVPASLLTLFQSRERGAWNGAENIVTSLWINGGRWDDLLYFWYPAFIILIFYCFYIYSDDLLWWNLHWPSRMPITVCQTQSRWTCEDGAHHPTSALFATRPVLGCHMWRWTHCSIFHWWNHELQELCRHLG